MESAREGCVIRHCDAGLVRAFELLGKRWSGLVLGTLSSGPASFSEMRRALAPITDSVLSERLNELAAAGLLTRSVKDTRPPGVIYQLTDAGAAIVPVLDQLATWATHHLVRQDDRGLAEPLA
ncbi:MAG: winged helix-turn-helix transcriptional regulator [Ferrimicrobium sp.]|uniref:winged helix-turn-helix transcriptional regulator n=1 Tax=Ferrimicrobium sp. TaxID=2926050 RepID=UPI00260B1624|nr:helix-turn-helix domain-containing protein [Ferrimicrobium sp.]MCL5973707.1 helix-turn-helix transcriptional regulator [Actinomycetota bacterium]